MTVRYAKGIAAVDVFVLRELRDRSGLGTSDVDAQFKRLVLEAVTLVVDEQLSGTVAPGGRCIDGADDEDGDGARLHLWLEPAATTCRIVILRFDETMRSPPLVTDAMAIVHGERVLIRRFIVYREPRTGSIAIEGLPTGRLSDERKPRSPERRPPSQVKSLVHRARAALSRLLPQLPPSQSRLQAA